MEIELNQKETWPAGREPTLLGELVRMEIAKHIWDSRHSSKLAGFEYAKHRGTRNMMDPARPRLDRPREFRAAISACQWMTRPETRLTHGLFILEGEDSKWRQPKSCGRR